MPIPMIILPAIELAFQVIERAIADKQLTPEQVTSRIQSTIAAADASEKNLDQAIADAEASHNED